MLAYLHVVFNKLNSLYTISIGLKIRYLPKPSFYRTKLVLELVWSSSSHVLVLELLLRIRPCQVQDVSPGTHVDWVGLLLPRAKLLKIFI